jgi:hypothetical protein
VGAGTTAVLAQLLASNDSALTTVGARGRRLRGRHVPWACGMPPTPPPSLRQIDLTANRLDESDAFVLSRAMATNATVTCLDLRGNPGIADHR